MPKISAIALFALCFFASVSRAETLYEIYRQALVNDHAYKSQRAAYEAGLEEKNIGRANLLPQISGDYTWADLDTDTEGFNPGIDPETGLPIGNTASNVQDTTSGYSVELTQPLIDLAAWHSYKRGALDSKVALAQFNADSQDLIIRTAEAYLNVLRTVDNFETAKAEENANSHQLEQTKKRFEVGLTAITEVHEAQAAYDNARARRLLQEGNVGIVFEALEVLTGQSYAYIAPLKEDFPIVPPTPAEREEWVKFSVQNNFSLAATSLAAESARQTANQFRAAHYPTIYAGASYSDRTTDSTNNGFDSELDREQQAISVTLNVPIFSGGGTSARRRQAAKLYLEAKERYLQAQRDTIQNARSLHLSVVTDVATVMARRQAITSNQSAVEATQAGYEVGTRDLVDVLVAQRSLYQARNNYADTLYIYILNTLLLKEVAGLLTEKDIVELDRWLDTSKRVSRKTQ